MQRWGGRLNTLSWCAEARAEFGSIGPATGAGALTLTSGFFVAGEFFAIDTVRCHVWAVGADFARAPANVTCTDCTWRGRWCGWDAGGYERSDSEGEHVVGGDDRLPFFGCREGASERDCVRICHDGVPEHHRGCGSTRWSDDTNICMEGSCPDAGHTLRTATVACNTEKFDGQAFVACGLTDVE
jgi:hypothetical protein